MIIAILVLVCFFFVIFDLVPIIQDGQKKDAAVYITASAISLLVLILYSLDIKVPGPTDFIISAMQSLLGV